nr:unnamed protein product [Haemonchus contortus]
MVGLAEDLISRYKLWTLSKPAAQRGDACWLETNASVQRSNSYRSAYVAAVTIDVMLEKILPMMNRRADATRAAPSPNHVADKFKDYDVDHRDDNNNGGEEEFRRVDWRETPPPATRGGRNRDREPSVGREIELRV